MAVFDEVDPAAYGRTWAEDYDDLYELRDDTKQVVGAVADLLPTGSILEFGVGTGRLALPLADAGYAVTGVDAAPEMLDRLRARPDSERIKLIQGDFATVEAEGAFDLILIAFSTLFLIPSQQGQLACLANAERHLRPGGRVIVEAFVPDHSRWTRGQNLSLGHVDADGVTLKLSVHDPVHQVIRTQDVLLTAEGTSLRPNLLRYIWPSELDAMALASGLQLERRTADWSGLPFGNSSTSHISVYGRR